MRGHVTWIGCGHVNIRGRRCGHVNIRGSK